jgi:Flp pilus assembly protein CpaB
MVAVGALASLMTGHDDNLVDVVTVVHRVPSGQALTENDLTLTAMPAQYVPEGAINQIDQVVGQTVSGALPKGDIVTKEALLRATSQAAAGRLVLPIPLTQAELVDLLQPGSLIALIISDGYGQTTVVDDVVVVGLPTPASGGLFGGGQSAYALVEVSEATATLLAGSTANVTIALR